MTNQEDAITTSRDSNRIYITLAPWLDWLTTQLIPLNKGPKEKLDDKIKRH